MGVVVGDETRVGDMLQGMSQGHVLVPDSLVMGGLQGVGCGHGWEVLAGGGGVSWGQGTRPIHLREGGGHAPGRGRLHPFVEGRGPRWQQWWTVRRRQVQHVPMCGLSEVAALAEWVCWRADHDVVIRGGGGEEVGAHVQYVRHGADHSVVLMHGQVACGKGRRGDCWVEGRGVTLVPEVDRIPVRIVQIG